MQKTIIDAQGERATQPQTWMDLERIASVEVTSEDDLFPVEHALGTVISTGWRAAQTGPQMLRLRFHEPQELHLIEVHIADRVSERTQEWTLSAEVQGLGMQELRRQQFSFSPRGSTEEIEEIHIELAHVTMLELRIDPDRAHNPAESQNYATLTALRLA